MAEAITEKDPKTLTLTEEEEAEVLSQAERQKRVAAVHAQAYIVNGHVEQNGDGEDYPSTVALRDAAVGRLAERVITTSEEYDEHAATPNGLTARLFPEGVAQPGSEEYRSSEINRLAWKGLVADTWRAIHTKSAQKAVAQMGERDLLLCFGEVVVGSGMKATTEKCAFVTNADVYVLGNFVKPYRDTFNTAASDLAKGVAHAIGQAEKNPALRESLAREIDKALKSASKTARDTLALEIGEE